MNTPTEPRALIVGTPALLSAVVLNADTQLLVDDALAKAAAIVAVPWNDAETFNAHKEVSDSLGALKSTVDAARLAASKPHRDLTDAINAAGNAVLAKVNAAHQRLGGMLKEAERKAQAERDRLIAEQRRREEEARAEAERIRAAKQKAIDDAYAEECRQAQALHNAQVAAAEAARASAAPADGVDAMPEDPPEVPALVLPPPPPVFTEPEEVRQVYTPSLHIPEKLSSGVRTTKAKRDVRVVDIKQVPHEVGGVCLWTLDLKACKQMAELLEKQTPPKKIPGLELVEVGAAGIASTGRG